ncbi:hypothetical protein FN846DRAFT_301180 [Neofusicoccum parvum]|uniref:Uncharacterized protein n=1 Tax=Neofusicoccum parvum TaxID=310453 RepID=A0ACB5SC09_9PEZI|nr:hypothetical protein FN846DRAFT_301180 [Neofusicoccum parvum]
MASPEVIAVPLKLDAFVLNAAVCGGSSDQPNDDENHDKAKIAPLSQPNYTYLRFERNMVQNDILNFTDLHKTGPAKFNSRFTDLGTGEPRPKRQGVYLHWTVPRPYRSGSTLSQDSEAGKRSRKAKGFAARSTPQREGVERGDTAAPDFRPAPARWLVIRKIDKCSPEGALPPVDAWVVESDRRQELDDIPSTVYDHSPGKADLAVEVDIQAEFSPFVVGADPKNLDEEALNRQAEVFIGHKERAAEWSETVDKPNPPLRVELNLLNSSNQLFPDYQPHNSNVFSIIDTLQYRSNGKLEAAEEATVSYYVLGWHSEKDKDPFGVLSGTRGERLAALGMVLDQTDETTRAGIKHWLDSTDPTRVVCHGAMYDVQWNRGAKPLHVPADTFHQRLNQHMPAAVGATPMDALRAYIQAHSSTDGSVKEVEQDLDLAQKLLHARSDGVDALDEADEDVANTNYASVGGGSQFFLPSSSDANGENGRPTKPAPEFIAALDSLNSWQEYLDGLQRQLQLCRWEMFGLWWQYMTNVADMTAPELAATQSKVKDKTAAMEKLIDQINSAAEAVGQAKDVLPDGLVQLGALPPFRMARDPTLLVAGIESGWPYDYLQQLRARLDTQTFSASGAAPTDAPWAEFCSRVLAKLPEALQDAAGKLVNEFLSLHPASTAPGPPSAGYRAPLYHDVDEAHVDPGQPAPWRDRWEGRQGWFPLFLEWEAEYTHVPAKHWALDQRSTWQSAQKKLRYAIAPDVDLAVLSLGDKRTVSGRVLMLPQVNASVEATVTQLLAGDGDGGRLRKELHGLAFLSSPLSGFVDHLLTRVQGNHVKPTLRTREGAVEPFAAAVRVGAGGGFGEQQLRLMGVETGLTPYATLVPFLDPGFCPFKPAAHGQFRFTALNIIDKFGQAIHAIDPTPAADGPPPLYPCLGDSCRPQALRGDATRANTVTRDAPGRCQYAQLPPAINQPARLNGAFVDYCATAGWRPLGEWDVDRFVWGWVVPNYVDNGIQLFLPDGTFFREIRRGGPLQAATAPLWLPFHPPPLAPPAAAGVRQLQHLADQLADSAYLASFTAMLDAAVGAQHAPPTAMSDFLSSLVGKPLALVNVAYSLELATAPLANASTVPGPPAEPDPPLLDYRFPVQLGDGADGLVAYFMPSTKPEPGDVLQLDRLFTHHVPAPADGAPPHEHLHKIDAATYPALQPFWVDPTADGVTAQPAGAADTYRRLREAQLRPFGALVDPFAPLHAATGVLPRLPLRLPTWTWQAALARMTAFFRAGPLLLSDDAVVPAFDSARELRREYDLGQDAALQSGPGIGVPGLRGGDWAWLQAYSVADDSDDGQQHGGREGDAGGGDSARTAYMALRTEPVDLRPRFDPAPYTAVEGYMQLRRPIGGAQP